MKEIIKVAIENTTAATALLRILLKEEETQNLTTIKNAIKTLLEQTTITLQELDQITKDQTNDNVTKIYRIYRTDPPGHDEYREAVVTAKSATDAQKIYPGYSPKLDTSLSDWVQPKDVSVKHIGTAAPKIQPGKIISTYFRQG